MESVLDAGFYEDYAAGFDRTVFVGYTDGGAATHDVVNFVLGVRLLRVNATCGQRVKAHTERRHPQELQVRPARLLALLDNFRKFKCVHAAIIQDGAFW